VSRAHLSPSQDLTPLYCLDVEGVLVPEIWVNVAKGTGIKELMVTTRDEPNYDVLMKRRLKILKKNNIRLRQIQKVISKMRPLPGAKSFLDRLRAQAQVILFSDTYYEFAQPLMKKLGYPTLFCNWLKVSSAGEIRNYCLRQKNGKEKGVRALKSIGFRVHAAGDSFNDLGMLKAAHRGVLFNPPTAIAQRFRQFPVARSYPSLFAQLTA